MSRENRILEYASPSPTIMVKFPTVVRVIVLLFLFPTLVIPLLAYMARTPPLAAAAEFFSQVMEHFASPDILVVLGFPLVLCHVRLFFGELSRVEVWVGYAVAALGIVSFAIGVSRGIIHYLPGYKHYEMSFIMPIIAGYIVPAVVIALGACVVWILGKRVSHGTRICACLCILSAAGWLSQAVYPYATFLFGGDPRIYQYFRLSDKLHIGAVIVGNLIELTTLAVMAFRGNCHQSLTSANLRG